MLQRTLFCMVRVLILLTLALWLPSAGTAFEQDLLKSGANLQKLPDTLGTSSALGTQTGLGSGTAATTPSRDEQLLKLLEDAEAGSSGLSTATDREALLKGLQSGSDSTGKDDQVGLSREQKKQALLLKAEAGDGLVKLNWRLVNTSARLDNKPLRFIIRYGIESEKPQQSIQLGSADNFVVRNLNNYQPYFIQVVAIDRDQQKLIKSDEVRVTPLPAEEQGSRLESVFARDTLTLLDKTTPEPFRRSLKQFGYNFFRNTMLLSSPNDTLPAGPDYVLGPGDTLQISIWGGLSLRHEFAVDRNGEIMLPKVGTVRVWGLTVEQAKAEVHTAIGRYYRNFEMHLTLGKLRTIQVFVVGEVEVPGSYPISSLATVINALAAAGGPTQNGSLRTIKVTRAGQQVTEVDLYEMLLSGDRSKDSMLQNGDTIFVPVIGPVAAVAGEVRRPAIYEMRGPTSLADVLSMAGGMSANAYADRIQIERVQNNTSRVALDITPTAGDSSQLAAFKIQDRDMVKVFPVAEALRQVVLLRGNLVRPGEYQLRPGMRLTDLIPSPQALLPESYLESVEVIRLSRPEMRREVISVSLRRAFEGNERDNIELQEQDTIRVFSRWDMEEKPRVAVNGAVVTPGTYDYYEGMSVRDLVTASGSPKRNAFLDRAELSRVVIENGKALSHRVQLDLGRALAGDPQQNLQLQPDDVLIVRGVTDWIDATDKFVHIKGEVQFPGIYSVARGEKLSSVIERAGGFTTKAYLRGAKFMRKSVREVQQKRMEEIIDRTEREVLQKQSALASIAASREELEATKATLDGLMQTLRRMKEMQAEGRVVMRLAQLPELEKSSYDIEMEGGDELEIPVRPAVVHVLGQVYNATSFVYDKDAPGVETFLQKSGGPSNDAEASEMYIIKADGSVFSRQQSSFGIKWNDDSKQWSFGGFMATPLEPGDTLVVPQKIERVAWLRQIKDITQILANVALTAGTILIGLK